MKRPILPIEEKFAEVPADASLADKFTHIYETNFWGNPESASGNGSTLEATTTLRTELPRLLRDIGAKSLLDIPCGDFRWMSTVELGIPYIGADIVDGIVQNNINNFSGPDRQFMRLDITESILPQCDVILVRDCLVHLSYENIERAFFQFYCSGAEYVLMTSFVEQDSNRNIVDGNWRPLNFTLAPFYLPQPEHVIIENCTESDYAFTDKALCLWRVSDLGPLQYS